MEQPMQQERDNQQKAQSSGEGESSLPELKLTERLKSSAPLVRLPQNIEFSPEKAIIQPYGEYTVVLGQGGNQIGVIDSQGRKIDELTNTEVLIADWRDLRRNSSGGYYGDLTTGQGDYYSKNVSGLPARLRPYAEEMIRQNGGKNILIPQQTWRLDTQDIGSIKTITIGDKYVLFVDKEGLIAFQAKNEQGVNLPPRNWKRLDSLDSWINKVPPEIRIAVNNSRIEGLKSFIPDSERGFGVNVHENDVKIVKFGNQPDSELFTDRIRGVDTNLCRDPINKKVYYYCQSNNADTLIKLDTTLDDSSTWQTESAEFPQKYENISNLQLDPSGNFFMFQSCDSYVFLDKNTLQEAKKLPKFYNVKVDSEGRLRGIDARGHLVIYDANFQEVAQAAEKARVARFAQGLAAGLFKKEGEAAPAKIDVDQFQHLVPAKTDFETQFNNQLQTINNLDNISDINQALNRLKSRLSGEGLKPDQIDFITGGIADSIRDKEVTLAAPVIENDITSLDTKLSSGNLTLASIAEARADLAELKSLEGLADENTRSKITALESRLGEQSAELFRTQGAVVVEQANGLVSGVRNELEQMTSMPAFADFQEYRLPQLLSRLGSLANECPLEASDIQSAILSARRQIQDLSRQYENTFKEHYAQVRERASEVMGERVELLRTDVDSFLARLRGRGFKDRTQAETYMRSSESLGLLRTEIEEMTRQNPDISHELDRYLKVQIANIMSEVERGGLSTVAETGQQMELFGKTLFLKWEGHVKEKTQKKVDLIFMAEERTKGPGIPPDQIYGDVGLSVINSRGEMEKIRLYEGWEKEDAVRYGIEPSVPPSYVNYAEFGKIRKDYNDWKLGENSEIRKGLDDKGNEVREIRRKLREAKGNSQEEETLRGEYKKALDDYLGFYGERHLSILHRVDRIKNAPESEYENGKGFVPEWESHWVVDNQTEKYLENMAGSLKMQIDLQADILNLKGHTGTGKDLLVKMFANRTNRPYFAMDCTKWTTEFELSEDVTLESKDGASQTVKVPSVVLNAITTPGAIMYFNEMNAMTEQAQIFLHGLMDEKRTLTLKTSSGKSVKADKDVLLIGSMNPDYPGTFAPQFATRGRMVELDIEYPPLYGERDQGDTNPNRPFNSAEPLRIARSVDSLSDFTYESNPEYNDFVKIWDKEVNGVQNDAPDLNPTQKFDLEVILALTQFGDKLREGFMLKFDKARVSATRGNLLVSQPISGREMRRCAYILSKMPDDQKATADPEGVARELLEKYFLTHIDNREERGQVRTAMATWTSSKRPAA